MSESNIPEHWVETQLGEISEYINGRGFKSEEWVSSGKGLPIIRIQNLNKNNRDYHTFNYYSGTYDDKILIKNGDLLFCWSGAVGTSFGARIYEGPNGLLNQHIFKVVLPNEVSPFFYLYQLMSLLSEIQKRIHGGVGLVHITKGQLLTIPFSLPPLAEQERIVQKIESCFHKTDATEKALNEVEILLTKYRESLLAKAFKGELIPQDPKNEPASTLLEKIRAERAKNSNGKKVQEFAPISDEEKPFDLPLGWEWVRLGEVIELKNGYAFKSQYFTKKEKEFVLATPGNFFEKGGFRDQGDKIKYYDGPLKKEFILDHGDMIVAMTEQAPGLLGSAAIIPNDGKKYLHNQRLGKITPSDDLLVTKEYLYLFFNHFDLRNELANSCSGSTVRHTSPSRIFSVLFPLAPIHEQARIVSKIEQSLKLLESLSEPISNKLNLLSSLRLSVLSKAFQGSLVPKINNEGSGQELREKILKSRKNLSNDSVENSIKQTIKKTVKKKAKK